LVSLGLTETKKEDKVEGFFEEDNISKIEEILEKIEKGEITGEEAIEKMKEVKNERGDD